MGYNFAKICLHIVQSCKVQHWTSTTPAYLRTSKDCVPSFAIDSTNSKPREGRCYELTSTSGGWL